MHPYYYFRNGQGDIIGLFDGNGTIVARYSYDSWGNLLKITDGSGNDKTNDAAFVGYKNPLRYRGYYYDSETKLYYLQSRCYNPEWGRFLNADGFVSTGQGLIGTNMFAYCDNNPVMFADPSGYCSWCGNPSYNAASMPWSAYQRHLESVIPNRDIEVERTLKNNRDYLNQCIVAKIDFYFLVDNNGEWDYKVNIPEWLPENGVFMYKGMVMDAEAFGNYNYGYMGTYLNFTPSTLLWAGGQVAVKQHGKREEYACYYYDDPNDNFWVKQGIFACYDDYPPSASWFKVR